MTFRQAPAPIAVQVGERAGQAQLGQGELQSVVVVVGGAAVGQKTFGILPELQLDPPPAVGVGFGQLQVQVFAQAVLKAV
jgi:hypothetical protein